MAELVQEEDTVYMHYLNPKCLLHLAASSVRTFSQVRQLCFLTKTLKTIRIDICFVPPRHTQNTISVITLRVPDASSLTRPTLRMLVDPVSSDPGDGRVGFPLRGLTTRAPLDLITVRSRLYVAWLGSSEVE